MSEVLCVTDRRRCRGSFLEQLEKIAAARPAGIMLREKDLSPEAYLQLARQVKEICSRHGVPLVLHSHPAAAAALGISALHMPLQALAAMEPRERSRFALLGASCHSPEDAALAGSLGCTCITAGHVFETTCKPGLPPRGLSFLQSVCAAADMPVWAIGGVRPENFRSCLEAGAAGVCVMGAFMEAEDPAALLARFRSPGCPAPV